MPSTLNNPKTVVWSHSDSTADFFELPTEGAEMHQALGWLLKQYGGVKLWMGLETEEGAELFLTCVPSKRADVVNRLRVYDEEDEFSMFQAAAMGE